MGKSSDFLRDGAVILDLEDFFGILAILGSVLVGFRSSLRVSFSLEPVFVGFRAVSGLFVLSAVVSGFPPPISSMSFLSSAERDICTPESVDFGLSGDFFSRRPARLVGSSFPEGKVCAACF